MSVDCVQTPDIHTDTYRTYSIKAFVQIQQVVSFQPYYMRAATTFVNRAWIEKALLCDENEPLPRKVKAYVLQVKDENGDGECEAVIADSDLKTRAVFSKEALLSFLSDDTCEDTSAINEAYITITDYKVGFRNVANLEAKDSLITINSFKLFGPGHCNVFYRNCDSSECPAIKNKLTELWETDQLRELCEKYFVSFPTQTTDERDYDQLLNYLSYVHSNICQFPEFTHSVEGETSVLPEASSVKQTPQKDNSSVSSNSETPAIIVCPAVESLSLVCGKNQLTHNGEITQRKIPRVSKSAKFNQENTKNSETPAIIVCPAVESLSLVRGKNQLTHNGEIPQRPIPRVSKSAGFSQDYTNNPDSPGIIDYAQVEPLSLDCSENELTFDTDVNSRMICDDPPSVFEVSHVGSHRTYLHMGERISKSTEPSQDIPKNPDSPGIIDYAQVEPLSLDCSENELTFDYDVNSRMICDDPPLTVPRLGSHRPYLHMVERVSKSAESSQDIPKNPCSPGIIDYAQVETLSLESSENESTSDHDINQCQIWSSLDKMMCRPAKWARPTYREPIGSRSDNTSSIPEVPNLRSQRGNISMLDNISQSVKIRQETIKKIPNVPYKRALSNSTIGKIRYSQELALTNFIDGYWRMKYRKIHKKPDC